MAVSGGLGRNALLSHHKELGLGQTCLMEFGTLLDL